MTRLGDKRVGIVGTGATGIQIVPTLGRDAGELYVFRRTPSAVGVRGNHEIDPEWFGALERGWQAKWLRNFAVLQTTGVADEDLVHDGRTHVTKRIFTRMMANASDPSALTPADFVATYHESDDEKIEEIRRRVDEIVEDPQTATGLKAWYRQFCKRPCFHDEYLPTFNQPNVHLVDTDGKGVERIDEMHAKSVGAGQVEVLPEAEADWIAAIEKAPTGIVGGPDRTPGYYNSEGQAEGRKEKLDRGGYPLRPVPFFDYIADWRTNGRFEGLALR